MTKMSIDEPTLRQIMDYYGIGSHDVFAKSFDEVVLPCVTEKTYLTP